MLQFLGYKLKFYQALQINKRFPLMYKIYVCPPQGINFNVVEYQVSLKPSLGHGFCMGHVLNARSEHGI